ncbi:hypothetical protein Droror1_Dr00004257 [Drosera rotundifolia]
MGLLVSCSFPGYFMESMHFLHRSVLLYCVFPIRRINYYPYGVRAKVNWSLVLVVHRCFEENEQIHRFVYFVTIWKGEPYSFCLEMNPGSLGFSFLDVVSRSKRSDCCVAEKRWMYISCLSVLD